MRILVLALSGIGDALMFTPALEVLKKQNPSAEVDALVMFNGVADMYRRNPLFNKVMYFNFIKEGVYNSLSFILKLRGKYDYSLNVYPSNRIEYNGIQWLVGAKVRGGIRYLRADNKNFGFLNTLRITENDLLHNVEENILLVEEMFGFKAEAKPALSFPLHPVDISVADTFISRMNQKTNSPLIGFHPGCATLKNHIMRRWEPEKFIALGKKLITEKDATILLFGGPEEADLRREIYNGINSDKCYLTELDNLPQSAALMERCAVFVTNDSSLMHVSAAMQRKTVAIIGPTNTAYIHPWKTDYKIVSLNLECAPCFFYSPKPLQCTRTDMPYKCIRELDVDLVYQAVADYLSPEQQVPVSN